MRNFRLDFARRPFRDERPLFLVVILALAISGLLFAANVSLYRDFHREMEGTSRQIDYLEKRRARLARQAEEMRAALNGFQIASLATESQGLVRVVGERRFSWTGLLARLERTLPPEVRVARLTPKFEDSGETSLDLALVGKNPESVVRTLAALARDPAFTSVELKSETTPEQGVPEGYSFSLLARYRPEGRP